VDQMRLYLTISLFLFGHILLAQNQGKIPISVSVDKVPLEVLLDQIANQASLTLAFNSKKIDLQAPITFSSNEEDLHIVLDKLGEMTSLSFKIVEKQIIIKNNKPKKSTESPSKFTFSGYIKDANSGEALIGATIYVDSLKIGSVSNAYGFYSLTLPKGIYEVSCSFIGYEPAHLGIDVQIDQQMSFDLKVKESILEEIVVLAAPPKAVEEIQLSKTNLRPTTVASMPALFGEMDVIKSLANIPGIKFQSDGSTFFYVRGGNRDQNLILQDEAVIYNPTHLLGLFSTIIPDATKSIEVYKGEVPANYGGKLSSVIDIHTKNGNNQQFELWGNVGLISTKLGIEGPFKKGKSSYLLAGRLSRIQWFAQVVNPDIDKLQFSDLTGKVNFQLNPSNNIYGSFYLGGDEFTANNNGISWQNQAGTIRWNNIINDKLFANTTFSASNYEYFFRTNIEQGEFWRSKISYVGVKTDFSYFVSPDNILSFGLGINGQNFNPGNYESPINSAPPVSIKNTLELTLYANQEVKLTPKLGLNYGLRFTSFSNLGESFEFVFDENHQPIDTLFFESGQLYNTYNRFEPRATISYTFNEKNSIKASYARNVQNIHLISNTISPFNSIEVWMPSSLNILPETANQYTVGYFHYLEQLDLSLSIEGYYKKMMHQIGYENHANTLLNPAVEGELRFGEAKAYGLEFMAKKEAGRLNGWLGYSYARVKRNFAELNNGRTYNAFSDRPNEVNIVLNFMATLRWSIGLNWLFTSGAPFSSPTSFFNYDGQEVPIYANKHNSRLPNYHRMDIGATFKLNKNLAKRYQHALTFSIYNLYGRKNPVFINFNKVQTGSDQFKIPANLFVDNRTTSSTYLISFMPSISYNFRFK
jgi:outer membrane receptor for ferrienterochelin and colicin